MDMNRFEFWVIRKDWPGDTASHVFLGNAVNEIGKALFGSDWTGAEPATELMPLSNRQRERGCFGEKVAKDRAAKRPAMERFSRVKATIIRLAETEHLTTALRPKLGGDPVAIHRSLWNSERLSVRFDRCQMNPRDPFGVGVAGDGYCWIFVTRESLRQCLAALAPQLGSAAESLEPESTSKAAAPKKSPGRKKGDGSYAKLDLPILDEMKELISSHRAASPEEAARLLAEKAHGAGSVESKAERLAKRYRAGRT
jgi:hypothetical protein